MPHTATKARPMDRPIHKDMRMTAIDRMRASKSPVLVGNTARPCRYNSQACNNRCIHFIVEDLS